MCGGGGGVFAEEITSADYTVITPEGLSITRQGWNPSTGITASSDRWIKITVTASTDSKLTSEHGHVIPYVLTNRDGGSAMTKWEFSPVEVYKTGGTTKSIGAIIDFTGGRPGTYTTNLTYIVSAERVPVDLSLLTGDYEAQDGDILTGTATSEQIHITVASGATITLKDATITSIPNDDSHKWAGITPLGDATVILEGTNTVKGGRNIYPGLFAATNATLTIKGTGSLTASTNQSTKEGAAGIGGGYSIACGNIRIEGGTITATGGGWAAAIGSGSTASCGTITIS